MHIKVSQELLEHLGLLEKYKPFLNHPWPIILDEEDNKKVHDFYTTVIYADMLNMTIEEYQKMKSKKNHETSAFWTVTSVKRVISNKPVEFDESTLTVTKISETVEIPKELLR
ncbi:hypothetical protein COA19_12355 [Bacillus thuringiensis]|uniref:hypothetical protein n=1 Tax=Bacillus thuringiensis TaxID=1428 RepID=UPI000BFD5C4A|nr:hypothetical protein [Bacillus thuringiensis]PGQ40302.1 hypothetical protein COA19_12355 [Bacillus thuringiensis]